MLTSARIEAVVVGVEALFCVYPGAVGRVCVLGR